MYKTIVKPFLDFVSALIIFIMAFPVFIIIFITLCFINDGKPFFYQKRPGKSERIFKVIKFKTMSDKTNKDGQLLSDTERLTKFGVFIRQTSLDEIPQLLNVLKGDMSLVGPRPLLPHYLPLYTEEQKKRHNVKPGITGLAQVKGRNLLKFSERFKNDIWYVDNISLKLDMKILITTVKKIISSDGVVSGQDVHDVDDLGFNKKR